VIDLSKSGVYPSRAIDRAILSVFTPSRLRRVLRPHFLYLDHARSPAALQDRIGTTRVGGNSAGLQTTPTPRENCSSRKTHSTDADQCSSALGPYIALVAPCGPISPCRFANASG